MDVEYYKTQIEKSISLDSSYKLLNQALEDDEIGKRDYMIINGSFLRAKAEFDAKDRLAEPDEDIEREHLY